MVQFGYSINKDRQIDFDAIDRTIYFKLAEAEPSVKQCISCGSCTSTCSAGKFTNISFRNAVAMLKRGNAQEVKKMFSHCMLCGKCQIVCPRGINTRNAIIAIHQMFANDGK